ncbi:MAG: putative lipid II flippase FtsW [Desulfobacterales bacterium]
MTASVPAAAMRTSAYDVQLLFPVLLLVGVGIVMIYSASSALAADRWGDGYFFLKRQGMFAAAGVVVLVVCRHLPYRWFKPLAYPILILAVAILVLVLIPGFGKTAGGATRWLRLGAFTLQPSEFARFALILYLAYSLSKKGNAVREFAIGFVPHAAVLTLLAVPILMQPDFGSVVILTLITGTLMFVGGVPLTQLAAAAAVALPIGGLLAMTADYRFKRVMSFMNPWDYPTAEGYQVIHSLMAFGSGGVGGSGIGRSLQKLYYLPEPHTDFIFSVIGEELGLIGVGIVIVLYGVILWRSCGIARRTTDPFGSLMAIGLTAGLYFQVCINMGVALGLLPTKGLTLPFLSYGGSSLLLNMAAVGILMNIGATARR